ncbi:hypothetical protein EVAR_55699_1 [Eumeta japonica]|uniref:Uncharacterized protein n=1 Tax=Eumeta variegata TaxID=151549 RepID=A0A4C1ZCX4_EUMVA|nr:hypothetical protein EVAR_55699_1 [Eumeta japonica]
MKRERNHSISMQMKLQEKHEANGAGHARAAHERRAARLMTGVPQASSRISTGWPAHLQQLQVPLAQHAQWRRGDTKLRDGRGGGAGAGCQYLIWLDFKRSPNKDSGYTSKLAKSSTPVSRSGAGGSLTSTRMRYGATSDGADANTDCALRYIHLSKRRN